MVKPSLTTVAALVLLAAPALATDIDGSTGHSDRGILPSDWGCGT